MRKRAFAWLLSFAMLLSFIPNAALANEPDSQNSILEIEQHEAENVSDTQDTQAKVAETAVAQDERRSAEAKTLPSTRDESKYETPDATQSVIPEEDNDNAVTDVLEQNADAHLAEDALVQGLTPAFSDVQRGMLLGESVEIIASGECGANGSNVTWTLDANGVLTISGTGAMTDDNPYNKLWTASQIKELVIQSGVTSIGAGAFYCSSLTSVTIPDSVTSIGYMAFRDCRGLTSVTIPDSVTSIGNYTFDDCSGLTSVTIPNSVTSIGVGAFRDCRGLTSITIPEGVTSIGNEAFYDCRGLTNVTIPASVTIIGDHAFYACIALTNIQVHNENKAYKSVDGVLFNKSGSILLCYPVGRVEASYLIPDGVTNIEYDAFRFCRNLMDVTLPDSITSIGDYAFEGCSGLTSVTVPEGVTSIGYMAFINCSGLTSVTIPDSVTSIGDSAFSGCSNLTDLYYIGSETQWNAITIGSNNAPLMSTSTTIHYWTGENWTCKEFGIIASGVCGANGDNVTWTLDTNGLLTISGSGAMADCGISVSSGGWNDYESAPWKDAGVEVRSVIVENGVTNFGAGTFSDCNQLESVAVPESVTDIGASAFRGCRSLTSFDIPSNVTNIGDWAFYCSGLTSVDIPVSVTSIGNYAFWNCVSLTSVTIPGNVISIGDFAFGTCCLESVSILNGVTSIGDSSFASCTALTSVSIPDSVTNIGQSAFANCKNLTSVTIPNGVTQITRSAFHYCESLKSVNIPESVTEIKDWAFYGCSALTDIYYLGSEEQWNAITIGSNNAPLMSTSATIHYNWTGEESTSGIIASGVCGANGDNVTWTLDADGLLTISGEGAMANYNYANALWRSSSVKSVVIETGVTAIGQYAFYNCKGLISVAIPDSVTDIKNCSFYECRSLTSVEIPNSVTNIQSLVFEGCNHLRQIVVHPDNKKYASQDGVLYNKSKTDLIRFPCGSTITEFTIPDTVTHIDGNAFENCNALIRVTIPNSVTTISISNNNFVRCSNLQAIEVSPDNKNYVSQDGILYKSLFSILPKGLRCGMI